MNLELISRRVTDANHNPPLVLVHGAWHGAWCWEGNFLEYFPENGWETHAISLRGHGNSGGSNRLRWTSISNYVDDLVEVISSLDREPILIGHSMGGFLVQKYLENHSALGGVLLASVPPSGILLFNLRLIRRHPIIWLLMNLSMSLYPIVKTPELVREWFFLPGISKGSLQKYHARLQNESFRAALDMLALILPDPSQVKTPIAVVGAEMDQVVTVPEIVATAKAYDVEAKIFPDMAHIIMFDTQWRSVADWILEWASSISREEEVEQVRLCR